MKREIIIALASTLVLPIYSYASESEHDPSFIVSDKFIAEQRIELIKNTKDKGFGPQSPRDIDLILGNNARIFNVAPSSTEMNLCNIHFHKNAEHKGGEFTHYAGNGNGAGFGSGYQYSGKLNALELKATEHDICPSKHGGLSTGDTIEAHYVYSTAQVNPGPTLGSCLSDAIANPQLRVETQVYVLVNDNTALNFNHLSKYEKINNLHQAINIPTNTGTGIQYAGSTTGPSYNEKGSPFQVTWNVRPNVAKVNINSVGEWCKGNVFNEDHAHGVRNLVKNPELISSILQ